MPRWTLLELLNTTKDYLERTGSPTARLDTQLLLGDVLGLTPTQLYMQHDRPMVEPELEALRERVARRAKGEPIAYILGEWEFWSLTLKVDSRVLIPRPDTELIVERVLAWAHAREGGALRIVDVGTGSGCIALALASELPEATVLGLDISADALDVAAENAEALGLRERVKLMRSDLLGRLVDAGKRVDLVVSNPPYIGERERASLDADVRDFEPEGALFSGPEGLDAIRRLVPQAAQVLEPEGALFFEIGASQGAAAAEIARGAFDEVEVLQDLGKRDRVVRALRPR